MERFDLYTQDRVHLNRTIERGNKVPEGCFRLVVHACIFNDKGEMLIQKRQATKKSWPNLWDFSVGGSAISGETSLQAIQRETKEELGLELDDTLRPVLTFHFDEGFDDIYVLYKTVDLSDLRLQAEEVQDVRWACKEEMKKMSKDGTMIPWGDDIIELLFTLKDFRTLHRVPSL